MDDINFSKELSLKCTYIGLNTGLKNAAQARQVYWPKCKPNKWQKSKVKTISLQRSEQNKNSPSLSSPQTTHRKRSFTFVVIVINLHLNQTPIYLVGSRNVSLAQYVNSKL